MRLRRLIGAAVLVICIGAPILEAFDQWDRTPRDGNDSEANVVIVALCVGIGVAIGTVAITMRLRHQASTSLPHSSAPSVLSFVEPSLRAPMAGRPPTPLRV